MVYANFNLFTEGNKIEQAGIQFHPRTSVVDSIGAETAFVTMPLAKTHTFHQLQPPSLLQSIFTIEKESLCYIYCARPCVRLLRSLWFGELGWLATVLVNARSIYFKVYLTTDRLGIVPPHHPFLVGLSAVKSPRLAKHWVTCKILIVVVQGEKCAVIQIISSTYRPAAGRLANLPNRKALLQEYIEKTIYFARRRLMHETPNHR